MYGLHLERSAELLPPPDEQNRESCTLGVHALRGYTVVVVEVHGTQVQYMVPGTSTVLTVHCIYSLSVHVTVTVKVQYTVPTRVPGTSTSKVN